MGQTNWPTSQDKTGQYEETRVEDHIVASIPKEKNTIELF